MYEKNRLKFVGGISIKILIGQPKRENKLEQLIRELESNSNLDIVLYPEGYFSEIQIEQVCKLAANYTVYIVAGYKDSGDKDRAFIVNKTGEVILERAKTPENETLYSPSKVEDTVRKFGYLLCREIFQGLEGLEKGTPVDIIFNPIGVGMFSEDQYKEWTEEARKIAVAQKALVIGVSHADGSYRNCGVSLPIAYCFDENGEAIMLSKNDIRTRILDTNTRTYEVINYSICNFTEGILK